MIIEAMKQALEALDSDHPDIQLRAAIALRQAIEQAERPSTHSEDCYKWHHACAIARIERAKKAEPVAWLSKGDKGIWFHEPDASLNATPLYTSPPQRQWVGLTDEEREKIVWPYLDTNEDWLITTIEAKLKEKNT